LAEHNVIGKHEQGGKGVEYQVSRAQKPLPACVWRQHTPKNYHGEKYCDQNSARKSGGVTRASPHSLFYCVISRPRRRIDKVKRAQKVALIRIGQKPCRPAAQTATQNQPRNRDGGGDKPENDRKHPVFYHKAKGIMRNRGK